MRGPYEESPEAKSKANLRHRARVYAGHWLRDMFGPDADVAEGMLVAAALAYADAVRPAKKPRPKVKAKAKKTRG